MAASLFGVLMEGMGFGKDRSNLKEVSALSLAHHLLAPAASSRPIVINAILGLPTRQYDPTVRSLMELRQDVVCRIFSHLEPASLCCLGARASSA